jgi:hypothetical protein
MAINFDPDLYLPGDTEGQGYWLMGHYREHRQFVDILAAGTPTVLIPDFPLLEMGDNEARQRVWLETHENAHALLRSFTNVTGTDFALVDLTSADDFNVWMDSHAFEHRLLRAAFGIA